LYPFEVQRGEVYTGDLKRKKISSVQKRAPSEQDLTFVDVTAKLNADARPVECVCNEAASPRPTALASSCEAAAWLRRGPEGAAAQLPTRASAPTPPTHASALVVAAARAAVAAHAAAALPARPSGAAAAAAAVTVAVTGGGGSGRNGGGSAGATAAVALCGSTVETTAADAEKPLRVAAARRWACQQQLRERLGARVAALSSLLLPPSRSAPEPSAAEPPWSYLRGRALLLALCSGSPALTQALLAPLLGCELLSPTPRPRPAPNYSHHLARSCSAPNRKQASTLYSPNTQASARTRHARCQAPRPAAVQTALRPRGALVGKNRCGGHGRHEQTQPRRAVRATAHLVLPGKLQPRIYM
jgi:hypothetical protein